MSGILMMERIQGKTVAEVTAATVARLRLFRDQLHTITSDNAKEFATEFEIDFYCARLYHS